MEIFKTESNGVPALVTWITKYELAAILSHTGTESHRNTYGVRFDPAKGVMVATDGRRLLKVTAAHVPKYTEDELARIKSLEIYGPEFQPGAVTVPRNVLETVAKVARRQNDHAIGIVACKNNARVLVVDNRVLPLEELSHRLDKVMASDRGLFDETVLNDASFPPYDQVIPKRQDRESKNPAGVWGCDAYYLADLAKIAKAVGTEMVKMMAPATKLHSPCCYEFTSKNDQSHWLGVLMPMKI